MLKFNYTFEKYIKINGFKTSRS